MATGSTASFDMLYPTKETPPFGHAEAVAGVDGSFVGLGSSSSRSWWSGRVSHAHCAP
jgi:hypothetical protein